MNKPLPHRLTGNPAKASKIRDTRAPDCTSGELLFRTIQRAGDLGEESRTFRATVATDAAGAASVKVRLSGF